MGERLASVGLGPVRAWLRRSLWDVVPRDHPQSPGALRRRQPAMCIRLHPVDEAGYDELLISSPHARLVSTRLHHAGVRGDRLVAV